MHDLRAEVEDKDMVARFALDWRTAELDERVVALLEYCTLLTQAPTKCSQEAVASLRGHGWSDVAISDAVQVCSYFNYINRIAEGLGVDDEAWLDDLGVPRTTADEQAKGE